MAKFPLLTANAKAHGGWATPAGSCQARRRCQIRMRAKRAGTSIGHDVSELLPELTLAQKWDLTANELRPQRATPTRRCPRRCRSASTA